MEDLLGKKSQFLEKKINDELETAKKHGTKNKRRMFFYLLFSILSLISK